MDPRIYELTERAKLFAQELWLVQDELKKVIVGQQHVIDRLLLALCADGHVLLEGVPGIAKTLTIRTLSQCIRCSFTRLQFTPDILPSDIMGTKVYNQKDSSFFTVKGPIFTNFVLADEINRAPPKVQSALLEAMQERQVTIQGETYPLPRPFFVLATENPIESEGTYPLPEAQVDRFMFKVMMNYPRKEEEVLILDRFTEGTVCSPETVITAEKILEIRFYKRGLCRCCNQELRHISRGRDPLSTGLRHRFRGLHRIRSLPKGIQSSSSLVRKLMRSCRGGVCQSLRMSRQSPTTFSAIA